MNLNELLDQWLRSASIEDRNAFLTKLWKLYEVHLFLWARSFLRNHGGDTASAHDLNAEFFEKKLIRITPDIYMNVLETYDSFDSWLWRIHKNWCYTWLYREKKHVIPKATLTVLLDTDNGDAADGPLLYEDLIKMIATILGQSSLTYKIIILYLAGFSMKEVAFTLGLTDDSVKCRLYRAKKKLRNSVLHEV